MNLERVHAILGNKEKFDVFYNNHPVWIQEINNNTTAKVGFINEFKEKEVSITDLSEK